MEYDDEAVLTDYVWTWFLALMATWERHVGISPWAMKLKEDPTSFPPETRKVLEDEIGHDNFSKFEQALAEGIEPFRHKVARRVLDEFADVVLINRCPCCDCVVRTPRARQCFWCGHDWH